MNEPFPPTPRQEVEEVAVRLAECGVSHDQIVRLVQDHSISRIRKQLDWLPLRRAKKPAALIVAAIEKDYDAPAEALSDSNSGSSSYLGPQ